MLKYKIKKIKKIKEGLNNDISIIQINQNKKKYILKKYKNDKRNRLLRELYFLNFAKKIKYLMFQNYIFIQRKITL